MEKRGERPLIQRGKENKGGQQEQRRTGGEKQRTEAAGMKGGVIKGGGVEKD